MTRFEQRRFAALIADVVGPPGALPAVSETDAVAAFERWLRAAPAPNRLFLRALLLGRGRLGNVDEVLRRLAAHMYYGDPGVMRRLGYDAGAVVARARALRVAEGRP